MNVDKQLVPKNVYQNKWSNLRVPKTVVFNTFSVDGKLLKEIYTLLNNKIQSQTY